MCFSSNVVGSNVVGLFCRSESMTRIDKFDNNECVCVVVSNQQWKRLKLQYDVKFFWDQGFNWFEKAKDVSSPHDSPTNHFSRNQHQTPISNI